MRTKHIGINLVSRTVTDVTCLVLSYIVVGVSYCLDNADPNMDWFRRSGSIMILLAVIVEYQNSSLQQRINEKATYWSGTIAGGVAPLDQPNYRRLIVYFAHITIIIGTLIAGYGDILCK